MVVRRSSAGSRPSRRTGYPELRDPQRAARGRSKGQSQRGCPPATPRRVAPPMAVRHFGAGLRLAPRTECLLAPDRRGRVRGPLWPHPKRRILRNKHRRHRAQVVIVGGKRRRKRRYWRGSVEQPCLCSAKSLGRLHANSGRNWNCHRLGWSCMLFGAGPRWALSRVSQAFSMASRAAVGHG